MRFMTIITFSMGLEVLYLALIFDANAGAIKNESHGNNNKNKSSIK